MKLFSPDYKFKSVTEISPAFLAGINIKAILVDLDNTLALPNNEQPLEGVAEWIKELKDSGIFLLIISNNHKKRVSLFAKNVGVDYISRAAKPLRVGFRRAVKAIGASKTQTAIVGDQIFTDILGGNIFDIVSILIEPNSQHEGPLIWLKRRLEKLVSR